MDESALFTNGYALIMGVGADLPVTIQDALGIRDILIDNHRCSYHPENTRLLVGEHATRHEIISGFTWLSEAVNSDPESTAIVYFSGHGGYMPDYHLVPFGYSVNDISGTAISGDEFSSYLAGLRSQKLLVLLDCCHAGGMAEIKSIEYRKGPIPPQVADFLSLGRGRALIASSRKNEVSYTGDPFSQFTLALREALAGYGSADRDGYAYLTDVAMYVGRVVPNRTQNRQNPILQIASADNFPIAYYAGGSTIPKALPEAGVKPLSLESMNVDMVEGYRQIQRRYKQNLLDVEMRISEFYDSAAVPLDLERTRSGILVKIEELESRITQESQNPGW